MILSYEFNHRPNSLLRSIPFIGWWPIYWYGISWVLAILTIHWVAKKTIPSTANFSNQDVEDFLFYGVFRSNNWRKAWIHVLLWNRASC